MARGAERWKRRAAWSLIVMLAAGPGIAESLRLLHRDAPALPSADAAGASWSDAAAASRPQSYVPDGFDYSGVVFPPERAAFRTQPQPVGAPAGPRSTGAEPFVPPFTHFVVIFRENHAFDDYLGDCKKFNSSCDGVVQTTNHIASVPRLHDLAKTYALMDEYSTGVAPPSGPNHWYLFASAIMTQKQQGYYPPHGTMFDRYLNTSGKVTFVTAGDIYWEVASGQGWFWNASKPGGAGPDWLPEYRPGTSIPEELDFENYTKNGQNTPDDQIRRDYESFVNRSGLPTYSFIELFNDHPGTYQDIPTNDNVTDQLVSYLMGSKYRNSTVIFVTEDDTQNGHNGPDHVSSTYRVPAVVVADAQWMKQGFITHTAYNTTNVIALAERIADRVDPGVLDPQHRLGDSTFPLDENDSAALADPLEDLWVGGNGSSRLAVRASASVPSGPAPLAVQLSATATGQAPLSYRWDFGDGSTSTAQDPAHTFGAGDFFPTVTVTDAAGVQGTATVRVTASGSTGGPLLVDAEATSGSGQPPLDTTLVGRFTGGTPPYGVHWDLGDGTVTDAQDPAHRYAASGSYLARLTVEDHAGTRLSKVVPVSVATAGDLALDASAAVDRESVRAPAVLSFTGGAQGGDGQYSYAWDFGDGTASTARDPTHLYPYRGTYVARLDVTDKGGNTSSYRLTIDLPTGTPGLFFQDRYEAGAQGWQAVTRGGSAWNLVTTDSASPTHSATAGNGAGYDRGTDADWLSPAIDLRGAVDAHLSVQQKASGLGLTLPFLGTVLCPSCGTLAASPDGQAWSALEGDVYDVPGWTNFTAPLGAAQGLNSSQARLKLTWQSDALGVDQLLQKKGWFVDDVTVWGTPRTFAPGEPLGLQATPGSGSVRLDWVAPFDDGGAPVTRYDVYRGAASGAETLLGNTTSKTFTDSGLAAGATFFYQVRAVNPAGEGPRSREVQVTVGSGGSSGGGGSGGTAKTFFTDDLESGSAKWTFLQTGGSGTSNWHNYNFSSNSTKYWSPVHALSCGGGTSYTANTDCEARTASIDLSLAKSANLTFHHRVEGQADNGGFQDYGTVKASTDGGSTWCTLETHLAGILSWRQDTLDLASCPGVLGSGAVLVDFEFVSDASKEKGAWYVDDVSVQGTA